jgi:hypothetical protein
MNDAEEYGPMALHILDFMSQVDDITTGQLEQVNHRAAYRGPDLATYAWRAARAAGREQQVANAGEACSNAVKMLQLLADMGTNDAVKAAARSANDVGIALASRDLIGTEFYGRSDYERLVYPWKGCFPQML